MKVLGSLLVSDIMETLEMDALPEGCAYKPEERIDFDDVEVEDDHAAEELPESYFETSIAEALDQNDLQGLAEAIRTGDVDAAECALDRIFGHNPRLKEWIDLGRYSPKARAAKAPATPKLRNAA